MIDSLDIGLAMIEGAMLGAIFFGGLWWTVRKAVTASQPALWFFSSMLLRMSIVVLGFYFILGDDWRGLLAGLFGFMVARIVVTRFTRVAQQQNQLAQEASHAP